MASPNLSKSPVSPPGNPLGEPGQNSAEARRVRTLVCGTGFVFCYTWKKEALLVAQFTVKNVLRVLKLMAESESAMSGLYEVASRTWRNEWQFWQDIAEQEKKHSEYVWKMIELISGNPDQFRPGRPFTADAMNAFLLRIRTAIADLEGKALSRSGFISLALSLEQHMIEANYSQIVITGNAVYKALEKEILSETSRHKEKITSLKEAPGA
jgi:hypothetical protein